jgi:copper resistance protein D
LVGAASFIRFVHLAALMPLVGVFAFRLLVSRPALKQSGPEGGREFEGFDRSQIRLAEGSLWIALLSALVALWIQSASITGLSLPRALDPGVVGEVLAGTWYGVVWLARAALMLMLGVVLVSLRGKNEANFLRAAALTLAAAVVAALAFSGHAVVGEGGGLLVQLSADALHLLASAVWLGGLASFAFFLFRIKRIREPWAAAAGKEATRRFSRLGAASVAILIFTGLFNSWNLVGSIPPLVGTVYGKLLLLKLGLLTPLIALAAVNLAVLKPRIFSTSVEDLLEKSKIVFVRLRRNVLAEAAFGACILAVVGALSVTPPARHVQPSWPLGFRWDWTTAMRIAKNRADITVGTGFALVGLMGIAYGLFRRREQPWAIGVGLAGIAYGSVVVLPALSIDAYPATYSRPSVPYQAISVANGLRLYQESCAVCHGVAGYGDGPAARGLKPKPSDLTAKHTSDHTVGDIFWWITHGIKDTAMPAFSQSLSEEDRWDLINFLRTLSAAEQARSMASIVEPDPWLVAPDFVYRTAAIDTKALKDHRGQEIILLVLFTSESAERLKQLGRALAQLKDGGVEVLAVPSEPQRLGRDAAQPLSIVTDGSEEVFATYGVFRRSLSADPDAPLPKIPPHTELLIDRQGYIRARWIDGEGVGWSKLENLLREIERLNREKPSTPAPDEHVH